MTGIDFSKFDLDETLPMDLKTNGHQSSPARWLGKPLREIVRGHMAVGRCRVDLLLRRGGRETVGAELGRRDEAVARDIGLRLYKVGMTWPLEPQGVRGFAEGLGQLESAQKLLDFIRSRYPSSPLLDEVDSLQAIIVKLAAVKGA